LEFRSAELEVLQKLNSKLEIKTVELFAGVGGFRLGLESNKAFKVVWSNQYEPSTKVQHASRIYTKNFSNANHSNDDIEEIVLNNLETIPSHDLLVGGFPCQDYSVAKGVNKAQGLVGKKGVLWWSIYEILRKHKSPPDYLILENVDRLLNSPGMARGRDFAVMLASLNDLNYIVEWRVINAADYGMPQKRKRIFILAYKKNSKISNHLIKDNNNLSWLVKKGLFAKSFPIEEKYTLEKEFRLNETLDKLSDSSMFSEKKSLFENTGIAIDRNIISLKSTPKYDGERINLKDILINDNLVSKEFFLNKKDLTRWKFLKGAKTGFKTTKEGHTYPYSEGKMSFPDSLDKPGRTIITKEGGNAPSRFKHVVLGSSKKLRRLTPIELERLNMFPDDHTKDELISDSNRAFLMGNALVVGIIKKIANQMVNFLNNDE